MARVALCWELGGGFGHLFPLLALGRRLRARGHQVAFVVRDAARAAAWLGGFELHAAPSVDAPPRTFPLSRSYAENLLRNGYWHAGTLRARLAAWVERLRALAPDVVLVDHAPAALLAARSLGVPRAATGVGFALPPLVTPMPTLQPWLPVPESELLAGERRLLEALDAAGSPLPSVAALFEGTERFLTIAPECDHYEGRGEHLGPLPYEAPGAAPRWPDGPGARVFVYLGARSRFLEPVLDALRELDAPTLAWVGEGTDAARWRSERLRLLTGLVDLDAVARECGVFVSHGGMASLAVFLRRGVPALICPPELEQAMLAHRLAARGLALQLNFLAPRPDVLGKIRRLRDDPSALPGLPGFLERHGRTDPEPTAARIVARCEQLARA